MWYVHTFSQRNKETKRMEGAFGKKFKKRRKEGGGASANYDSAISQFWVNFFF